MRASPLWAFPPSCPSPIVQGVRALLVFPASTSHTHTPFPGAGSLSEVSHPVLVSGESTPVSQGSPWTPNLVWLQTDGVPGNAHFPGLPRATPSTQPPSNWPVHLSVRR